LLTDHLGNVLVHPLLVADPQRASNGFQRSALGSNGIAPRDYRRRDHQTGTEQVTCEKAVARSGIDKRAEEGGAGHPSNSRSNCIKQCNSQRTNLQRKSLANRKISATCGGRSEKK